MSALAIAVAATAAAIVVVRSNHDKSSSPRQVAATASTGSASPTTTPSAASSTSTTATNSASTADSSTVPYNEGDFTASPPAGWVIVEDGQQMQGYVESKWHNPGNPSELVKVDRSPTSGLPSAQAAAQVQADLLREPGYQEISFGPGSLTQNTPSTEWTFNLPGSERVDWFFSECGHDFAVLGSTAPEAFGQMLPTFTSFAESVQATCKR
jgi:hypothetical protein